MEYDSGVIKYTAKWCGPCKKCQPQFEEVIETYEDHPIYFRLFDVDKIKDPEYLKTFPACVVKHSKTVKGVPTFAFFSEGKFADEILNWRGKSFLVNKIETHLMTETIIDQSGWTHGEEEKDEGDIPIPDFGLEDDD